MRIFTTLAALTLATAAQAGGYSGVRDAQVVPPGATLAPYNGCPSDLVSVYVGHTLYCHVPESGPRVHHYMPSGPHHHANRVVIVSPYGQGQHGHGHGVSK